MEVIHRSVIMVLESFLFGLGGVLLLLIVLVGFRRLTYLRGRAAMKRELTRFLDEVAVPDLDHCTGTWRGMPVSIALDRYSIEYRVQLPGAGVPFRELVERYASPDLVMRMRDVELQVDSDDCVVGSAPRENGLAESLISIEQRIALAAEIGELRSYARPLIPLAVAHAKPLVAIAQHDRSAPRRPVETHRP